MLRVTRVILSNLAVGGRTYHTRGRCSVAYKTRAEGQNSEDLTGSKITISSLNSWLFPVPDRVEEHRTRIPAKHLC